MRIDPTPRQLRWFGLTFLVFFGVLGGMVAWRTGDRLIPGALWATGIALCAAFYLAPSTRRPLIHAWEAVTRPIGWLLTHLVLLLVFALVLVPTGLLLRLLGRDPLTRRRDPVATTYWSPRPPAPPPERYFRQF